MGRHAQSGGVRRVHLQEAGGFDVEDRDIGDGPDLQSEHEAGIGAGDDRGAALGLEDQAAEVERDGEQQLQPLGRDGQVDEAARPREAQELHRALEPQAEAGIDAAGAQRLHAPGGVHGEQRGHVELQADTATEVRVQLDIEPGDEAFRVDAEPAVDEVDVAERPQTQRAVHHELDAWIVPRHLEAEQDLDAGSHGVGDDDVAGEDDPEAAHHADLLGDDDEVAGAVALEAVERLSAVDRPCPELEGLDGSLGRGGVGEGVDLEQEGAAKGDARNAVASEGEEDAADHAGLAADEHVEVERAGQRAEERNLRADRARELEARARARDGDLELDEAGQADDPADRQLGLDRGLDVDLASGRRARVAAAVERRRRGEDVDDRRLSRVQEGQERLRDLEVLLLSRRVEHHRDRAADLEQIADARDAQGGRRADLEEARHAGVLAGRLARHDDDETRGRAVRDLGVAHAEGQLRRGEQLEPFGVDAQEEPALHADQIGLGPRRSDADLADQLEREAEARQDECPRQVRPVGPEAGQGEGLGLLKLGEVDLQGALGEQEHAVLLERLEVGLQRGDAPELRRGAQGVAHVEHEFSGGGAHGPELDDLELAAEGQLEHLPRRVDLQRGLGLDLHQRLLEEVAGLEDDAARQLDEEDLGAADDLDLLGPRDAGVALGVRPAARHELHGQRAGVELPAERIAERDVVDLDDLVEDEILAVGAGERELVAVDRPHVDASVVRRVERDVEERPALERRGGGRSTGVDLRLLQRVAVHVLPAAGHERRGDRRVAELAGEEVPVGVRGDTVGVA